jgi:hypothetical protein
MDANDRQKVERSRRSRLLEMIEATDRRFHDYLLHLHLSHWQPISTAPMNHDLQLTVLDKAATAIVPFPCRRTNNGEWINADLGRALRIQPVKWRPWQSSLAKS